MSQQAEPEPKAIKDAGNDVDTANFKMLKGECGVYRKVAEDMRNRCAHISAFGEPVLHGR